MADKWSSGLFRATNGSVHLAPSAIKKGAHGPSFMADRVGFEPTIPLQVCRISSAVPSTARPPVRGRPDTKGPLERQEKSGF